MSFLTSIMKNYQELDYLLTWLASSLDGWNREELFHILNGTGRNGKGVLRDLIKETLGDYYGSITASMLTKERPSSDKPIVDLLNIKGKRLIIADEPSENAKINDGFLKFLTGNDLICGRYNFGNQMITFSPQHSLGLLCNNIPYMPKRDKAIWLRSRNIDFPYEFVTNPIRENEKKINKFLKSQINGLGPHFMLILIEYYNRYKNYGLEPTPEILKNTLEIREEDDIYGEFIKENLEISKKDRDRITQKEILEKCQYWIIDNYNDSHFSKKEATKAVENVFGKLISSIKINQIPTKGWKNIQWKIIKDEKTEDNTIKKLEVINNSDTDEYDISSDDPLEYPKLNL